VNLSPYLLNVALHALIISALVSVLLLFLRRPVQRSFMALAGVIGAGLLSWGTPLLIRGQGDTTVERSASLVSPVRVWELPPAPVTPKDSFEAPAPSAAPMNSLPAFRLLAAWAWLAGSGMSSFLLLLAWLRLCRWRKGLSIPAPSELGQLHPALPPGLSIASIRICRSEGSPCVAGFLRPLIVITSKMLASASADELRWTLRHEHRHLLGMDSRWTFVVALVRAVLWWNPFIHHLGIKWAEAREQVCDLHAAADSDRAAYGEFLIRMGSMGGPSRFLASSMVKSAKGGLRKRILSLLRAAPGEANSSGFAFWSGAFGSLIVLALFASVFGFSDSDGRRPLLLGAASAEETPAPDKPKEDLPVLLIMLRSKVIFTPQALADNQAVLTREEWSQLEEKVKARGEGSAQDIPTITCRNGEKARIEIIHENPESLADDKPKAGWQMWMLPVFDGKELNFSTEIHYGFIPGAQYSPTSKTEFLGNYTERREEWNWSRLVVREGEAKASLAEGSVMVTALGEVTPGWHVTVFTQAEPIDRTGRPVSRFGDAIYEPEPLKEEVSGKVRLRGILLEDFKDFDFPEVNGVTIGFSAIFAAEEWKTVKNGIGGKPLGLVTLEYGKELEPWKDLPGLKLAVRRYKGEPQVNVLLTLPRAVPWNPKGPARYGITCDPGTAIVSDLSTPGEGKRRGLIVILEEVE
jgi:beta-lactamase regulating signal transducer with metallopeptidase domain